MFADVSEDHCASTFGVKQSKKSGTARYKGVSFEVRTEFLNVFEMKKLLPSAAQSQSSTSCHGTFFTSQRSTLLPA
jgi:hypothetical protein